MVNTTYIYIYFSLYGPVSASPPSPEMVMVPICIWIYYNIIQVCVYVYVYISYIDIPVVLHKAVAEVSKIGNYGRGELL